MTTILIPDVLTQEQSETLHAWGVDAPTHTSGKRPEDGRFVQVSAPEGWKVVGHPHSMYRALADARGLQRALYFCKAAFYDRRTEVNTVKTAVSATFRIVRSTKGAADDKYVAMVILGSKYILWEDGAPVEYDDVHERAWSVMRERWPDFANYNAYWDLPVDGLAPYVVQA